jgi:hypothetical protein
VLTSLRIYCGVGSLKFDDSWLTFVKTSPHFKANGFVMPLKLRLWLDWMKYNEHQSSLV